MNHILHPAGVQVQLSCLTFRSPDLDTYQTNVNHPQHSKWFELRLILVMLWFLRVPLIVRTALIALLLFPLLASSAGAARMNAVRDPAHANAAHSTTHRVHRSTRRSLHTSRTSARGSHSRSPKQSSRTAAGPSRKAARRSARLSSHISSGRSLAALRRTRYAHSRSRAHFVPLDTVPVTRPPHEQAFSESETAAIPPSSNYSEPIPERAGLPSEAEPSSKPSLAEAGSVSAQDEDPTVIADAGNPLAEPAVSESSAVPAAGQIAELQVPRVYGRYALRGTRDSLVRQNERAEEESLERIEDDADLQDRITRGLLVRVPESAGLIVNSALPDDRRYCRPWTAEFLSDLSRAYEAKFHKPFVVSSAVRTVEYQKHLMRFNHNAADAEGDIVSPHLTGATIDIAKSGLSRREMQWMRDHLSAYQTAGVIDVEEEFRQRCFHITVYKAYAPASSDRPHHAAVPQTVPPDPSTATVSGEPDSKDK